MISYDAFGIRLDSDTELPELDRTAHGSAPVWRFEQRAGEPETSPGSLVGTDVVYDGIMVSAYSAPGLIRLVYDDTGTFEVRQHDRSIVCYPGRTATPDAIRADLLGRVIAFVALAGGGLALHASAVCIDGRAVALLGPKGAGKSTMALALVQRGARLITDDTLVLRFDEHGNAWASPGVQRLRLWDDSAHALGAAGEPRAGAKPTLALLPHQRQFEDAPLDACYVLYPAPDSKTALRRDRLSPVHAAMACVSFSKLGSLAGGAEAITVLDRSTLLSRSVPFHAAGVPRDLSRLQETAEALLAWHCEGTMPVPNVTGEC